MLLNKAEANILLIAGFYKAVPANLSPDLGGDTLKSLLAMNLLKLNRSKTACRLSNYGRELFAKAGFEFQQDKHPLGDGELLIRRLQSAEIALALQQIGVNVFLQDLPRRPVPQTYLSAYALRINSCSNILGMAKFSGYYFTPEMTYIIYHLESKLSGFYPNTESDTFIRHMRSMGSEWKVIFIGGKDYVEMFDLLNRKKESKLKNDMNFRLAVEEYGNVGILPLNSAGLRTLRIMNTPNYEEKLIKNLINFDAVKNNESVQINLDNDVKRLRSAAEKYNKVHAIIPIQDIAWEVSSNNINFIRIDVARMEQILGIGNPPDLTRIPFIDNNGNGIYLGERKIYA
jgi:hypothetical protein